MIGEALITFTGIYVLTGHMKEQTKRRVAGHIGLVDVCVHVLIIVLFHRTFEGLMQAEAAGIMVSIYVRTWKKWFGYERRVNGRWMRWYGTKNDPLRTTVNGTVVDAPKDPT